MVEFRLSRKDVWRSVPEGSIPTIFTSSILHNHSPDYFQDRFGHTLHNLAVKSLLHIMFDILQFFS